MRPPSKTTSPRLEGPFVKTAVETLNPTRVKLTVEVPYEELKPSLDKAYQTIGGQIQVPGFRQGKVPPAIIDQRIGRGAVIQEAINSALPQLYGQAVEEAEVRPIGEPEVDITGVPLEGEEDLKFTVETDVRPDIDLPDLDAIALTVDAIEVTEDDIAEHLASLQERFGTLVGVDRPVQDGDFVSLDLSATIAGEEIDSVSGVSYEVGSGSMLDGLDEVLVGMAAGDTREFTSPLAGGSHAGQDADCTVTVNSVKVRELPALDDDFAQLASEFDTLDELRADAVTQIEATKRLDQGVQARDRLVDQLLESIEIPVPDGVVTAEVDSHLEQEGRQSDDEHRAEVTEATRKSVASQFLLEAIQEREAVQVEQNELIEYLLNAARQYGMDPNQFISQIEQQGQIGAIYADVARRKALASVLERAVVTDSNGEPVDLSQDTADGDDAPADAPQESATTTEDDAKDDA